MFFSNESTGQESTVKSEALQTASSTLQKALEQAFNESIDKMKQQLAQAGITGQEQEKFLHELRKTVQSEIVNQFNQRIKEEAATAKQTASKK